MEYTLTTKVENKAQNESENKSLCILENNSSADKSTKNKPFHKCSPAVSP